MAGVATLRRAQALEFAVDVLLQGQAFVLCGKGEQRRFAQPVEKHRFVMREDDNVIYLPFGSMATSKLIGTPTKPGIDARSIDSNT